MLIGLICLLSSQWMWGQHFPQMDARNYVSDTALFIPRRPWLAASEVFGMNMAVWTFDRFLMNEDFAKINGHTIKQNFKTGPVWDTDKFSTNLPKGSGRTRSCPRYHLIFPQRGRSQPGNGGTAAPYWCSGAELGSHLPPSGGETCTGRLLSLPPAVGYSSSATLLQDLIIWDFQRVVKGFGRKAACQALTRPSAHPPTGSPPRRPRGAPGHRTSGPHP